MANLIMWNLATLDGYFEGREPWQLEWHDDAWGDELERFSLDQSIEVGALLFGRKTYEGMAAYWQTATGEISEIAEFMNAVPKVVFSRTLSKADWNNTRLVSGSAEDEVARLKDQPGKDLFVFGSAELSASLMRAGLFDEYRVCIAPIVAGGGNPLFKQHPDPLHLTLEEARPLRTGAIILRYRPKE